MGIWDVRDSERVATTKVILLNQKTLAPGGVNALFFFKKTIFLRTKFRIISDFYSLFKNSYIYNTIESVICNYQKNVTKIKNCHK